MYRVDQLLQSKVASVQRIYRAKTAGMFEGQSFAQTLSERTGKTDGMASTPTIANTSAPVAKSSYSSRDEWLQALWDNEREKLQSGTQAVNSSGNTVPSAKTSNSKPASAGSYDAMIERISAKYGVGSALVKGVIKLESNFNPNAVSSAGAVGMMQLMPGTAKSLGVKNSRDAEQNIEGGVRYLKQLIDRYGGDVPVALAAYNTGPGTVEKRGVISQYSESNYNKLTDGMKKYARIVMDNAKRYA